MQPWRTATIIAACAVLGAQTLVREADIPSVIRYFVPVAAEKQFACTVFPAEPRLNYSFRFTAGYRVEFPVIQLAGTDRRIFVVSRVRPVLGKPSYFMDTLNADADSKEGDVSLDGGEFELGTGVYHIDWAMFDSSAGVCRREWNIVATLEPPNLGLELAIRPNTVGERGPYASSHQPPDARKRLHRITLLLDATPDDRDWLVRCAASLMERLPSEQMQIVVLDLAEQKETLRIEQAEPSSLRAIAKAINGIGVVRWAIDVHSIENQARPADFIAREILQELKSPDRSDAVIVIGPGSRRREQDPILQSGGTHIQLRGAHGAPRLYYLEFGRPLSSLRSIVRSAAGETFAIASPADLMRAIGRIRRDSDQR